MSNSPKIYVAGHRGMVGSAIVRQLLAQGHSPENIVARMHSELDLTDQAQVKPHKRRLWKRYHRQRIGDTGEPDRGTPRRYRI